MLHVKKIISVAALLLVLTQVKGQDVKKLRIGDPAPAIKYSKCLKGEPITSFKGDHVYIVEFWATWCGPCKAAMPHLTELQKQYEGKATFISVNIWEKVKNSAPYESVLPEVEKFVKGNSANMGFAVIADNNDQHMANKWMKAAGQSGIPSTFVIKDEKVIWIGNPAALDALLPKLFDGSYDMASFKARFDDRVERAKEVRAKIKAIFKPAQDSIAAKEYKKAVQLIDKGKAENPEFSLDWDIMKFRTLLKLSENDAIIFGNEWHNSPRNKHRNAAKIIEDVVAKNDSLSKSTYLWAARIYEEAYSNHPMIIERVASLCAKGRDYQKAITLQQKAVEEAKAFLAKGEDAKNITADLVTEYEKILAGYKKAAKPIKK